MATRYALLEIRAEQRRVLGDTAHADSSNTTFAGPLLHPGSEDSGKSGDEKGARVRDPWRDRILGELSEDFIRRMRNWARERDGGRIATAYLGERVDGWRPEQPIPTMLGEATDTHRALLRLPQRYQESIIQFWTKESSQTVVWIAQSTPRLRLWKLGPASLTEWLSIGHARLQVEIARLSEEQAARNIESGRIQYPSTTGS